MCALHRALPVRHVRHAQMLYYAFAVTRGFTRGFYDAALPRGFTRGHVIYLTTSVSHCV